MRLYIYPIKVIIQKHAVGGVHLDDGIRVRRDFGRAGVVVVLAHALPGKLHRLDAGAGNHPAAAAGQYGQHQQNQRPRALAVFWHGRGCQGAMAHAGLSCPGRCGRWRRC